MKFSQVLEYKTQTQINHHQIQAQTSQFQIQPTNLSINPTTQHKSNQIHPQQPPKIQIKKIKTLKLIIEQFKYGGALGRNRSSTAARGPWVCS